MAQHLNKGPIGAKRKQLEGGTAIGSCDPESCEQQEDGDREILPAVERPLAVPGELQGVGKGLEVRNGPLVAVRAAGADKIAEKMQMEAQENQSGGEPGMRQVGTATHGGAKSEIRQAGDEKGRKGAEQRKAEIVERMMVAGKPE